MALTGVLSTDGRLAQLVGREGLVMEVSKGG
jgi:hypothetical protein